MLEQVKIRIDEKTIELLKSKIGKTRYATRIFYSKEFADRQTK